MSSIDETRERLEAAGIRHWTLRDSLMGLDDALSQIEAHGLRWRGTRFDRYRQAIQDAREEIAAGHLQWAERLDSRALLLEALSQSSQLARSIPVWSTVTPDALRLRLAQVLSGRELPVVTQDATDHSRNILLELATAAFISPDARHVSLGTEPEDALLRLKTGDLLPIECKRPAAPETVEKNVKRVRAQLARHLDRFPLGGIAVIGIDRVVDVTTIRSSRSGLDTSLNAVDNARDVRALVKRMAEEWTVTIARLGGERLARAAPVVMAALFGAVLCLDPVAPIIVAQTAWLTLRDGTLRRDNLLTAVRDVLRGG